MAIAAQAAHDEDDMNNPYLLAAGIALLVLGFMLVRWAGRYDVGGLAAEAAWRLAKNRGRIDVRAEAADMLGEQFGHIQEDARRKGYVRAAAKHGFGFFAAKFVGIAGIVLMLIGLALAAAAFFI